ncbi:polyprenyl synthetase family protein [Gordonia sp. FQ]|uniref:polyprenyl synthetase family protein n=1 Tax=Gordonia sp. FQ TaxID=3446634 RepID=UPI003F864DCC
MLSQQQVPGAVEEVLRDFFATSAAALDEISPVVADAGSVLADFVLGGGKRIRPLFVHAGWHCGLTECPPSGRPAPDRQRAESEPLVVRTGAAIELIQACALVHDDILDRSDTRRGRPTVHRRFAERHRDRAWSGDDDHYGASAAILLGDLALAWADDLVHGYRPVPGAVAGDPLPPRAAGLWSLMRTEVLGGQLLDITNEVSGDESVDAAYRVMEYKTAAYTIARPLEIGAALGRSTGETAAALRRIGTGLGLAFQLRDDVLGAFGDPAQTGKPSGDDLVAGKRTVLVALTLAGAPAADADVLRGLLGRRIDAAELATARTILIDSGALAAVEQQIDDHLTAALAEIDALPVGAAARDDLTALAHRIAHRQT